MELMDVMRRRKSVRNYTDEPITEEQLAKILQAAMLAPTSRNFLPTNFIVVRGKELLEKLADAKDHSSGMLKKAACGIVVCGDAEKSDTWIEDCSIAMTYMHLMATELGLGSCWVQTRMRKKNDGTPAESLVREAMHIPAGYEIEGILSIGAVDRELTPRDEKDLKDARIHYETFDSCGE